MHRHTVLTFAWLLMTLLLTACTPTSGGVTEATESETAMAAPAGTAPEPTANTQTATTQPTTTNLLPDRLASNVGSWATDWSNSAIDLDELFAGGPPRDGIPPLDDPQFVPFSAADEWLADNEPVISLLINGDARAYPLQILTWHEIVNDEVGGEVVTVTFCPLCNSAIVFNRHLGDTVYDFGTSGLLRNSDLVMWDRQTESLWQQFTGEAIVGELTGSQLEFLPSAIISYADFKEAYTLGQVLSRETGFNRAYGTNPYAGYDTIGSNPFLFTGELDGRLPAMARVVTLYFADEALALAYPLELLAEQGVINDSQAGHELVLFHRPGTASALGNRTIAEGEDVGATNVFARELDGQLLTFSREGDLFVDAETGSSWNIVGLAVAGPLVGRQLTPIVHADHFWFSWAAFRPDTIIYQDADS